MTKSELRKYAKDNGLTLAEAREKIRQEAADNPREVKAIQVQNVKDAADYMNSLTDEQLELALENGSGKSGYGTNNLQIAANWARTQATPNSPPMYSDQFFSFSDNKEDHWFLIQILNRLGILLFHFTKNGAVLVHKDNPKLKVVTKVGQIVGAYENGENITFLTGLQGQRFDIAA